MIEDQCINPHEIDGGDLIAYLHGEASSHIIEHVTHCRFCSQQVEQMRVVDTRLLAAFYRKDCPAPDVLAEFALKRLPSPERLRIAAHLRGCEACADEVNSVRDLTDEGVPSLLTRLRESLALALIAHPVAQVATPARGEGWQGRFEVDDLIITLSSQRDRLAARVRRRDAPPDADYSGQAWLLSPEMDTEAGIPRSEVDKRGQLQFTGLAEGSYALLLQIGEQDVALEMIQVK